MEKRNPYLKAAIKDLPIIDQDAFSIKQLIELRSQGKDLVKKWIEQKLENGEWEAVAKLNDKKHLMVAYRPKLK